MRAPKTPTAFFRPVLCSAILFGTLLTGLALQVKAEASQMEQAKVAFRDKQYETALALYLAIEHEGKASPTIEYNIGVCYFRLKRYHDAQTRFNALRKHPDWRALADYNLGLVAEAQHQHSDAIAWFKRAETSDHEKIRRLSQAKLQRLAGPPNNAEKTDVGTAKAQFADRKSFAGVLGLSLGKDSNAASLADDLIQNNPAAEDRYREVLAYLHYYVDGQSNRQNNNGTKIYALGFQRRFDEFSALDSRVLGLGITTENVLGYGHYEMGLRLMQSSVDGAALASQIQGSIGYKQRVSDHRLAVIYQPSHYTAGDGYEHIGGIQHRLQAEWQKRYARVELKARYRFEINDRKGISRNDSVISYSPVLYATELKADWKITDDLALKFSWEHITRDYDGKNRQRDIGGSVKEMQRHATQQKTSVGVEYVVTKAININGEYQWTDNQDNFDIYDYEKNLLTAGVKFKF